MQCRKPFTAGPPLRLEEVETYVTCTGFENERIQKRPAMQTGLLEVSPGNSINPQSKRPLRHKDKV